MTEKQKRLWRSIHIGKADVNIRSSHSLIFFHLARICLGAVFLFASYDKILNPQSFAEAVYNYQILPDAMINLAALILPWLELLMGLCLISGIWLPGAVLLSTGLLLIFIAAMLFNQMRGLDIHCGCFSTKNTGEPVGLLWTVARDLAFLIISGYLTAALFFKHLSNKFNTRETYSHVKNHKS